MMFSPQIAKEMIIVPILQTFKNFVHTTNKTNSVRVVVAGACGGIGQLLSLFLKKNSYISELLLYDNVPTLGVATDLSHIDTPAKVTGFTGPEMLNDALKGADIVMITISDVARNPGITDNGIFTLNAVFARNVAQAVAKVAPKALTGIVAYDVNSLVPLVSEVFRMAGVYDPARIFGVCTLDVVRANTCVANFKGLNPKDVHVPVIGGHCGITTVPVISQSKPTIIISEEEYKTITRKLHEGDINVEMKKSVRTFGNISMAYAATRFCFSLIRALTLEETVLECAYIRSNVTEARYFSNPILLSKNGVVKNLGLGKLTSYEQQLLKSAIPELKKNIKKGEDFIEK